MDLKKYRRGKISSKSLAFILKLIELLILPYIYNKTHIMTKQLSNKLIELFGITIAPNIYITTNHEFFYDLYNFIAIPAKELDKNDLRGNLSIENDLDNDLTIICSVMRLDRLYKCLYKFTFADRDYYVECENNLISTLFTHARKSIIYGDDVMASYGWPENVSFATEYLNELNLQHNN